MGAIRTLGLATASPGTPTPAVLAAAYYTSANLAVPGVVKTAATFSITNNIATVTFSTALPTNGFNGPNQSIQGNFPAPNGQKVVLWGFTTATYFNGKVVNVIANPNPKSFSFYITNANVASTADTGNAAPAPAEHYRAIRLECSQALSTDLIYVGDSNVSSTQYMACLSLAGQLSIEIASDNIPPEGIWIDTNGAGTIDKVMVTLIY